MSRRVVFSVAAAVVAGAGVLWVGGMAAAAILHPASAVDRAAHSTATATTAPPASPSTPAPTPSPVATDDGWKPANEMLRPLRPGDHVVTAAQLRAFEDSVAPVMQLTPHDEDVWVAERTIEVQCMAQKGYYLDPRNDPRVAIKHLHDPRNHAPDPAALLADGGNTGAGDAYRWQDAGCYGLAVHETGNDGAH